MYVINLQQKTLGTFGNIIQFLVDGRERGPYDRLWDSQIHDFDILIDQRLTVAAPCYCRYGCCWLSSFFVLIMHDKPITKEAASGDDNSWTFTPAVAGKFISL